MVPFEQDCTLLFCLSYFFSYRISRGTAETLLDDKSFVDTYKDAIIEAAYNDYEDEYDDTYDTNAILVQGVNLQTLDDSDEEPPIH